MRSTVRCLKNRYGIKTKFDRFNSETIDNAIELVDAPLRSCAIKVIFTNPERVLTIDFSLLKGNLSLEQSLLNNDLILLVSSRIEFERKEMHFVLTLLRISTDYVLYPDRNTSSSIES